MLIDTQREQMFPVLTAAQIRAAAQFASGLPRRFEANEIVFDVGQRDVPAWLVLNGTLQIWQRDGRGREVPITVEHTGQFSGEVNQLVGKPTLNVARAGGEGLLALPFDALRLKALIVGSAEIGEIIMRALILRRVGLIEAGGSGCVLIGPIKDPQLLRLQGFLTRNSYPMTVLDSDSDGEGRDLVRQFGVAADDLPLMLCPNGTVLKRPSDAEAATCLGITTELDPCAIYDVAVVGAGPAGLATAVYAASEGLSVLVLDQRAIGGQAGASARIENYLGFPAGISGQDLAGRAFNQAEKFGAQVALPLQVDRLDCEYSADAARADIRLHLANGAIVHSRSMVIASGARYRRPAIANIAAFEGAGVSYWASAVEARLCAGEEVVLMGGGNSAGQAVVFLSTRVKRLHLVVRGAGLATSMSKYLIDRIGALSNVELHPFSEVVGLREDSSGLCEATFRDSRTGAEHQRDVRHIFLFIGADPNSAWLQGCVELDRHGFVLTGTTLTRAGSYSQRPPLPLETSVPGVFAIGDVRAGSTKRLAAAVGEGAAVVAQIHEFLSASAQEAPTVRNETPGPVGLHAGPVAAANRPAHLA
jgi:thioredoxin reductase (NADPH)